MAKIFYRDIALEVPKEVYEPREDSFLLAGVLEKKLSGKEISKVLEIGCGSGLLGIIAAKHGCEVSAVDIDQNAVKCAVKNSAANGAKINSFQSDLFSKVQEKFHLIIFNPPYLPEEISNFSRIWAGGKNLEVIFRFIEEAKKFLAPRGEILIVVSSITGKEKILGKFRKEGFSASVSAEKKIPWETLFAISAFLAPKPNL